MAENLNGSIVKGVSWNLIETVVHYLIQFVIGIILARLLTPHDYGLVGVVAIFITISQAFVKAGFGQAFIRKADADDRDASTVFYINLSISLAIYAILFLAAPLIARYFHQEQLVSIVRVLGLVIIVNAFNVIQIAIIRKNLLFKKKAIVAIVSGLLSGIAGIICAYNGMGVWSLVVQQILSKLIYCILLYIKSPWYPTLTFSRSSARSMFSYGSWLLLSEVLTTIMNNFYRFVIGHRYPAHELGLYDRAKQFQAIIADTFTGVFGMVAFPTLAKVQNDKQQMFTMTRNYVRYSSLIVFPLLCCLLVVAAPLISILITDKWLPSVPYLQVFCIIGMAVPANFFLSPLLQAAGMTRMNFVSTVLTAILRILNFVVTFRYGITALLWGELCVLLLSVAIVSLLSRKELECNYLTVFWDIRWTILSSCAMLAVGFLLRGWVQDMNVWLQLLLPAAGMMAAYALLTLLLQRNQLTLLMQNLRRK